MWQCDFQSGVFISFRCFSWKLCSQSSDQRYTNRMHSYNCMPWKRCFGPATDRIRQELYMYISVYLKSVVSCDIFTGLDPTGFNRFQNGVHAKETKADVAEHTFERTTWTYNIECSFLNQHLKIYHFTLLKASDWDFDFWLRFWFMVKVYMTWKIISACLKGLSKYRRMVLLRFEICFFVLEILTFFYYAN